MWLVFSQISDDYLRIGKTEDNDQGLVSAWWWVFRIFGECFDLSAALIRGEPSEQPFTLFVYMWYMEQFIIIFIMLISKGNRTHSILSFSWDIFYKAQWCRQKDQLTTPCQPQVTTSWQVVAGDCKQSASSLLLVVVFRYEHCGSLLVRCHPNYMPSSSETSMQTMGNHGNLIVGRTIARWYVVPFDASLWIISLSNFLLTSWGIYLFFSLLRGHSLISRLACLSNRFYRTC